MDRLNADRQLVLSSLREEGVEVVDVYELVNGPTPIAAIPALLRVLPLLENNAVKEGVVRALGDRAARGVAARPLIEELRRVGSTKPLIAWAIANSIAETADLTVFDELRRLVHDASLGKAREMLVLAIAKTRHPEAAAELATLTSEEALAGHIVMAASELRAIELRWFVERQLGHPQPWVRKEARKALARLE
jgi:hypothetical protein